MIVIMMIMIAIIVETDSEVKGSKRREKNPDYMIILIL